ncbi:MAG: AI-2E family transporter [Proteobacteria bacterium]|nr:AI-2E family transporter [Pseudomonadota bacterium]
MTILPHRRLSVMPPDQALSAIADTLRLVTIVTGIVFVFWFLDGLVLELFVVALLSLLLRGLAEALARFTRIPVGLAVAIVTVGLVVVLGLGIYYRGPRFAAEMQALYQKLALLIASLQTRYGGTPWGHYIITHFRSGSGGIAKPAMSVLGTGFGLIGTFVVVLLAAIYIAATPSRYTRGAVLLFPPAARPQAARVLGDCGRALQWWMLGQAIDMIAVAVISTTGLLILGIPLPYALGTLAGLLAFIPYFGAWIGSIPAILVALTVNVHSASWTILVFLLCHLVEGYILAPIVQRRTVDLPPAVTLLSMSIVAAFYGVAGLALATPIAAVVLVAVQEAYVQRLGSREQAGTERPAG